MLPPFQVITPKNIHEASVELRRLGEKAVVYAGGAELVLLLRFGMIHPEYLVNVKRTPGLNEIAWNGETVQIGATITHHRLETDPVIREHLPLLAAAESQIANIRVRSQGTLGGNLCFNDPHSDPGTALLVYDTSVRLANEHHRREMPVGEFLVGMYSTALEPGELLENVLIKPLPKGWGTSYLRVHHHQRPTLNVGVAAKIKDGTVEQARLAVGCVGPIPRRLSELEMKIKGLTIDDAKRVISESKSYLYNLLEPVEDILGSVNYKLYMTGVLLNRGLSRASA